MKLCGCKIAWKDYKPEHIEFCPLHKAAPDIYEAAKALLACLDMSAFSDDEVEGVNNLYNAIAKAEGK